MSAPGQIQIFRTSSNDSFISVSDVDTTPIPKKIEGVAQEAIEKTFDPTPDYVSLASKVTRASKLPSLPEPLQNLRPEDGLVILESYRVHKEKEYPFSEIADFLKNKKRPVQPSEEEIRNFLIYFSNNLKIILNESDNTCLHKLHQAAKNTPSSCNAWDFWVDYMIRKNPVLTEYRPILAGSYSERDLYCISAFNVWNRLFTPKLKSSLFSQVKPMMTVGPRNAYKRKFESVEEDPSEDKYLKNLTEAYNELKTILLKSGITLPSSDDSQSEEIKTPTFSRASSFLDDGSFEIFEEDL